MSSDDRDAFLAAYEANYADVLRYVQRRVPSAHVDDVVAETFAIAWRRIDVLPPQPRPWLFRTASNVMKSTLRNAARHEQLSLRSWEPPSPVDIDGNLDLVRAWRSLGHRDQEVLALHAWEGLTDSEAAETLGCTRSAFAMRLSRAKRRLADALRDPHSVDPASHLRTTEGAS